MRDVCDEPPIDAPATFTPGEVRYIKLGRGGGWASHAIEQSILPFGYHSVNHELCLREDWSAIREQLIAGGRSPTGASQGVREVREFYCLSEDTLWVTIADGYLWWAFAQAPVVHCPEAGPGAPRRFRRTRGPWSRESLTGEPLAVGSLSSALTRTANYRMTICSIEREAYLLRRIRGEPDPLHARATALKGDIRTVALELIRQLHWEEFETLVDLIFARGGWRRTSLLGQDQPDIDLALDQPVSGETAWVQVKTATGQAELDDYLQRFDRNGGFDRFFFVCHSAPATLRLPDRPRLHLWTGERLADVVLDVGLFDWLMQRTR
jgi:hypothetical protein